MRGGIENCKKIDGVVSEGNIQKFCDYLGITRHYYENLIDRFINPNLFEKRNKIWELKYEQN